MVKITHSLKIFFYSLLFAGFTSANAQEFSCDDLIGISDSSVEVRDALIELGTINEGDEVDSALGDLISELENVAEMEDNAALEDQISDMADGWEEMDGELLMNGLNGAINSLETLISNDC